MDWIDAQRSAHEPAHQWELKKKFMKKHKNKFSKEELCGLAQTMGNIEFMGCRYPRETHRRIAELCVGVIEEYRERKKGKLQRTFVKASDAAEGKVNRNLKRPNTEEQSTATEGNESSRKVLKYGMFVSSSVKDDGEEKNKLKAGIYAPKNKTNKTSRDLAGFSNQDLQERGRGFGFKESSPEEVVLEDSEEELSEDLCDSELVSCSLCKEICKRGARTDCCSARACRACATKEVTKSRACWSCNALALTSENLVNDEFLRSAVDHFKTHNELLPEHRNLLKKKLPTSKSKEKEASKKCLTYGMFVSSSGKEDEQTGKNDDDSDPPTHSFNTPSKDFMGFCNQVITESARGLGFKEASTTTSSLKYANFVSSSSKDECETSGDFSLVQCGLCKEVCKRGAVTDCCSARGCRACATKELTKSRACWDCNALGLTSANLVNHQLLREAADHYNAHQTLLQKHRDALQKKINKVEAPKPKPSRTPISAPKSYPVSKPPIVQNKQKHFDQRWNNQHFDQRWNNERQNKMFGNYHEAPRVSLNLDYNYPLHNFIVVMLEYMSDEHPNNILSRSGSFCKMFVDWNYTISNKGNVTCTVNINNIAVCDFTATTRQGARDRASEDAINILQQHCYTIKIKNKYLSDGTTVDLMEVEVNTAVGGDKPALGQENMGHKLLAMMGWSGGGLGKEGGGISEPITAHAVFGREGLGTKGVLKNFKEKITKILEEYIHSSNPHDLVFTTGFDNGQRAEMHQIARRLGLKSKSFGKKEDRFLTISRKQMNGIRLLEDLIGQGGCTEKYSVLEPGEPEAYNFASNFT